MEQIATIRRRLVSGFGIPMAVMLVMVVGLVALVVRLAAVHRNVGRLEETIAVANNLERLIIDAETGFRGFLLVGGSDFLEPTVRADSLLPTRFRELRTAVAGDPAQRALVEQIERTFYNWRELIQSEYVAKRSGGDYVALVASRRPKHLVDTMRGQIATFVARQQALRDATSARAEAFTRNSVVIVLFAGIVLAAVMWFVTRRQVLIVQHQYAEALDESSRHAAALAASAATLEERVADRTRELAAANEELEAFSYSVSHDLRAPLRHVAGFAQLLADSTAVSADPRVRHYVDRIIRRTIDAGQLIDDLLRFSRTGRESMSPSPVDTGRLVRDVIAALPDVAGRRIDWVIQDLPTVWADSRMLRQVFVNLIGNAVKYTRGRDVARIEISATRDDESHTFAVRDNGAGFDERYADKLFNVFQRLHTADEFEGTGIGLALVRRIVLRHGGRTWAAGGVGEGATFSFTLPRREPRATASAKGSAA